MRQISKLTTGHPCLNYLKELINTNYLLRAHAELPNYYFPLFEGWHNSLKSFKQFRLTCPSPQNKNSSFNEGILTFDKSSGDMQMKKWNEYAISELKSLSSGQLTDQEIAQKINQLIKERNFTAIAVKRKRHRLNLLKKQNSVINESTFYVKLQNKKGLGFTPAYMPLKFIKRFNIDDGEVLLFKKNKAFFFSKIRKIIRTDRPNDYYSFHVPFRFIKSVRFNEEQVEYIQKVHNIEKRSNVILNGKIDILKLLSKKINKRIQICLHPSNNNKVLIGNERVSVPLELPRYIQLSERLFQCLGFFQGEGTKGNPKRIEVVNTDSDLLNLFIDCLKNSLNIKNNQWRTRVTYTQTSKNPQLELKLKNYWSRKLKIPANNFVKTQWFNGTPDALKGAVQLYFSSYPLREVWINLLKLSHNVIISNKIYAKWFLQGVLAADGCPIFSKGILRDVMIRIENKPEGKLYHSALRTLGVYSTLSVRHRNVRIGRLNELQKIKELDLFILHKERNERFIKGLLSRKMAK